MLRTLLVLGCLALLALGLALAIGSVTINPDALWLALQGQGNPLHQTLLWELRLPRALAAFATGGLLAVAGALMQILLRNPLADPYVLGLSGGAAVGALLAMLAGLGAVLISGLAFTGAMLAMLLVFGLAQGSGSWTASRLLLTGVVVAAGWGAVITLILALTPDRKSVV